MKESTAPAGSDYKGHQQPEAKDVLVKDPINTKGDWFLYLYDWQYEVLVEAILKGIPPDVSVLYANGKISRLRKISEASTFISATCKSSKTSSIPNIKLSPARLGRNLIRCNLSRIKSTGS